MSTKTIAVRMDVYEKLAREKRDSESFTTTINRLLENNTRKGTCGDAVHQAQPFWSSAPTDKEADLMEALLRERRSTTQWDMEPLE